MAESITTLVGSAFTDLQTAGTTVITAALGAGVAVATLGGAANYVIKKVKGLLSSAG